MLKHQTIDPSELITVTGGQGGDKPKPVIPNHGHPQHSAAWWEIRRAQQAGAK